MKKDGHVELLVLSVLGREPAHGFAVIERIRDLSGGRLSFPEGTVYPLLHELEQRGLVRSEWRTETGRRRRVYRLTSTGRGRLSEKTEAWQETNRAISSVVHATTTGGTA